jgi:hypothetical protein
MTTEIGLNSIFVNDATYEFLMEQYDVLRSTAADYKDRFNCIKKKSYDDYMVSLSVK